MKEKISFQDKLLYATTIALIISNVATLTLALVFANALEKNIGDSLRLNVAETAERDLIKRTIGPGGTGPGDTDGSSCSWRSDFGCDNAYNWCIANCYNFEQGSTGALECNSCCEQKWHNCHGD